MRSSLICVVMVVAAAPAAASPEGDVEALVRTTVDHIADASSAASFAKGATVIGIHTNVFDFDTGKTARGDHDDAPVDAASHGKLWPMLFDTEAPAGTRTLGKVTVAIDAGGHTAWFQAPLELPGKRAMHVSGMAVLQGDRWQLRVFSAQLAIPDKELANHPVLVPRIAMTAAAPMTKLGKAIVSWFQGHSLAKHAASGVVLAGGSAPQELASGADAIKFAGKLDRLTLIPPELDAPDGAAVATGIAWLAISKRERDGAIEFRFAVYAVQDKGEWRWKSIQFACDQVPSRD
jgi:hypothetical protein